MQISPTGDVPANGGRLLTPVFTRFICIFKALSWGAAVWTSVFSARWGLQTASGGNDRQGDGERVNKDGL